jgi:hypothetical protein
MYWLALRFQDQYHVSIDRNFIKFSRDSEKEQSLLQRENEKKGANRAGSAVLRVGLKSIAANGLSSYGC